MKQTILVKQERPLLAYALSKLNPDVFSHPVWLRFGRMDHSCLQATVEELTQIAQEKLQENLHDACSLLLICAAYQNQLGKHNMALATLQQVLNVARQSNMAAEVLWSSWGACAICFQQEEYEEAAGYLQDLQTMLNNQKEWVLADFLEVIKQCIYQFASAKRSGPSGWPDGNASNEIIQHTCFWLKEWGSNLESLQPERHSWRLQWILPIFFRRIGEHGPEDGPTIKPSRSVWQSIKSLLRLQGYRISTETKPALIMKQESSTPYPADEDFRSVQSPEKLLPPDTTPPLSQKKSDRIPIVVQMLGTFNIAIQNTTAKIASSRGLSVLKYILLHHRDMIPREVLMEVFWPESEPEAARNNLNVAMHSLRQALRSTTDQSMICYEDGAYYLAANLDVWLDVEEFDHCVKEGHRQEDRYQLTAAVAEYEIAINLYRGDLLAEIPYEEWTVLERERLRIAYLETIDRISQIYFEQERYTACIAACQLILARDTCREDAHCRLMQCYSRLSQTTLALRQYQICVDALRAELDVDPAAETTKLYEIIRRREHI